MNFKLLKEIDNIRVQLRSFADKHEILFERVKATFDLYEHIARDANRPAFYPTDCNSIASRQFMLFVTSFLKPEEEEQALKMGLLK